MRRLLSLTAALVSIALPWVGGFSGTDFLMLYPDARTTALAGCGTALDDLEANPFYNPACIATGPRRAATWIHYPNSDMWSSGASYDYAGIAYRQGERLGFVATIAYQQRGIVPVPGADGDTVGIYRPYNIAPGLSAAYRVRDNLSVGASLKALYSFRYSAWAVIWDEFGLLQPGAGDGFAVAFDIGTQCRPWHSLTLGVAVENLGPRLTYGGLYGENLPALIRTGFAFRPHVRDPFEVALVGDVWREFVPPTGYPLDGSSAISWWESSKHGLGLEVRVAKTASLRIGYLEDVSNDAGGVVVQGPHGYPSHTSLLRFLFERHGRATDIGLCWGAGVEFGPVRFDVGVDESVVDYATRSIRFELSANL